MAAEIERLPGVMSATAWTKVAGRERIYVDLTSHNGGRSWNAGVGCRFVIEVSTGRLVRDPAYSWAGAATRARHNELGTLDAIRSVLVAAGLRAAEE